MPKLLLKLFIKNYDDTSDPAVRLKYGIVSGVFGIVTNLFLFVLKFVAGILSKSVSVAADAVNNLSDCASSAIVLLGFKMARKPADEEHPYGHARMEYLAGVFVSILVIFIGFQFLTQSINAILRPEKSDFDLFTVAVLVVSVAVKLWQGAFNRFSGKKIKSVALLAAAADSIGDVVSTSVVLVGIVAEMLFSVALDGYLGAAVAVFIIISGARLMKDAIDPIIGTAPDRETVERITSHITKYSQVLGYHDLVIHNYGAELCFASVHVELPADQDLVHSHEIIDAIESDIRREENVYIVIHLDPVDRSEAVNELRSKTDDILHELSPGISLHDFRVVQAAKHTDLMFDIKLPPDFKLTDAEIRHKVGERIKEFYPNSGTHITIDRNYTSTTE